MTLNADNTITIDAPSSPVSSGFLVNIQSDTYPTISMVQDILVTVTDPCAATQFTNINFSTTFVEKDKSETVPTVIQFGLADTFSLERQTQFFCGDYITTL